MALVGVAQLFVVIHTTAAWWWLAAAIFTLLVASYLAYHALHIRIPSLTTEQRLSELEAWRESMQRAGQTNAGEPARSDSRSELPGVELRPGTGTAPKS